MTIYKITHIDSGKIYIGQTVKSSNTRWLKHCADAENGKINTLIARAIAKYGRQAFIVEDICYALSLEHLDYLEISCIKQFDAMMPAGYNMLSGGGKSYKRNRAASTRQLISKIQIGRKASLSTRLKMSKSASERITKNGITESQRQALLLGHKAIKGKPSWNKGTKVTNKETLTRLSDSHKGQIAHNKTAIICVETQEHFESIRDASVKLNLQSSKICNVLKGKRKSTGGLTFKYKEQ